MAQLLVVRCRTKVACVPLMIAREGKGNGGEGDWRTWRRPSKGTEASALEVEDGDGVTTAF